jgi:Flp pilus assembly protein TadG
MTRLGRKGVVAAEFAVCGSLAVLVLLFVLEVGLIAWTKVALQAAAATAARCNALAASDCSGGTAAYAVTQVNNWLFANAVTAANVTVQSGAACNGATGTYSIVTITSTNWANVLPSALPAPLSTPTLSATSCYISGT